MKTKIEIAEFINKKGVHYEYCGKYNDNDASFVESLPNLDYNYIDDYMMNQIDNMNDIFEAAAFIVEPAYLSQEGYNFEMEGSIIALNK